MFRLDLAPTSYSDTGALAHAAEVEALGRLVDGLVKVQAIA